MKKILTVFVLLCFFITNVKAESLCSYEEQRSIEQEAANVKVNYEVNNKIINYEDGDVTELFIKVSIYNISENLYVVIKSEDKKYEKSFNYADTNNGVVSFDWDDINTITNFVIEVYSSDRTTCPSEKYKTLYLLIPRYNELSRLAICDNLDFYLCQEFVTVDSISYDDFYVELTRYQNKKIDKNGDDVIEQKTSDKIIAFLKQNKWYILGGLVIILGGTFGIYTLKTNKHKKEGL